MNLEKLFGSKTKVDILKYLLFRRQGVSMRALESELEWTFPAIKKQVESLESANIIEIDKNSTGRSITLKAEVSQLLKELLYFGLKSELINLFSTYEFMIEKYFFGKCFGINLDMDLVVIYKNLEKPQIDKIKESISEIFRGYFIEIVNVVFMSLDEWNKRYRLADRFVLDIMRTRQE
ncbi:MAG TPA: hypothetical protein PK674_01700 [Candidatus Absconditabacterales bacterium]|nr:hypothetical protein [Candidatus Absconditabacterales bacterium]HOQ79012.1 hypothetical protein [Candidatus Absconditabacterales bacterium]HPK28097.1 hypothetical protein [Candidatus Absconditabacterales bacterium]